MTATDAPPFNATPLTMAINQFMSDATNVLDRQGTMLNILKTEKTDLTNAQKEVDAQKSTNARMIAMNQNFSKRTVIYNQMVFVVAIALAAILVIVSIVKVFGLSDWIYTTLSVIIGLVVLVVNSYLYSNLSARDNTDYEKIKTTSPNITSDHAVAAAKTAAAVAAAAATCVGSVCCANPNDWDAANNICKATTISGFTTGCGCGKPRSVPSSSDTMSYGTFGKETMILANNKI